MEDLVAICPACGEEIMLDFPPETGENILCPQCNTTLEVVRKDPLSLIIIETDNEDILFLDQDNQDDKLE